MACPRKTMASFLCPLPSSTYNLEKLAPKVTMKYKDMKGIIYENNFQISSYDIGEDGNLMTPHLHDAEFSGLLKLAKFKYVLFFDVSTSGDSISIILSGVKALKANNFREGNVVLDICIYSGIRENRLFLQENLEYLYDFKKVQVESTQSRIKSLISKEIDSIVSGKLGIFSIASSYGCSLLALYEKLEIFNGSLFFIDVVDPA